MNDGDSMTKRVLVVMWSSATIIGAAAGLVAALIVPRARVDAWVAAYPHFSEMVGAAFGLICAFVITAVILFVPAVRRYIEGPHS